jgi:hypothetical protein
VSHPRWRTTSLDALPRIPGPGTLTWLPVRQELGIAAFGTNAYVAAAAGEHVVEPHDEARSGHQELYFVARGAARFTLDGADVHAPEGTYVFLADPAVHRVAVAEEPGTTVLAFGAPAGAPFVPSGWEPRFRAAAIVDEDPAGARALLEEGVASDPSSQWGHYDLACWEARFGDPGQAAAALARAVELGGDEVRAAAREDGDFDAIRDDPRFRALVA